MSFYLDTSIIVPLIMQDAHTQLAEVWLTQAPEPMLVSDFAALEFANS